MIRAKTEELKHIPWFAKAGAACSIVPISRFVGPHIFALKGGGYDGWYVIEAFGRALPGIAEATRVWRDFFPNTEEVYQFGHDFLRAEFAKA